MKKEIYVPTNLMEIPLVRYQKFLKSSTDEDSEFNRILFVSCMTATDINVVRQITKKDFDSIYNHLYDVLNQQPKYINRFKIDGLEFGAIPNFDKISVGELADLDTYYRDWETMHKAMAVMFRLVTEKKGNEYLIEEYNGTDKFADLMKYAPLEVVLGMRGFFLNLCQDLESYFQRSLTMEVREMIHNHKPEMNFSIKNGVGTQSYIDLLEEISKTSKKSEEKTHTHHSCFLTLSKIKSN